MVWRFPKRGSRIMTTEGVLLLIVVVGLCAAVPAGWYFLREQKKLIKAAEAKQAQFEQMARDRQERLSLQAAEQLEEQLRVRMERDHARILKLEEESAKREQRLDAQRQEIDGLRSELSELRSQLSLLRERNVKLATMVRRLVAQLERHEIRPDVDMNEVNSLMT